MPAPPPLIQQQELVPTWCSSLSNENLYDVRRTLGDQPLLAIIVHAFDERLEALGHDVALNLACRSDRLALLFRIERFGENAERLDLLGARQIAVCPIDFRADQPHHVGTARKAGEASVRHIVAARPIRNGIGLDLDEGGEIFAAVAEDDRLRYIGAGAQNVLDE